MLVTGGSGLGVASQAEFSHKNVAEKVMECQ